MLYLDRTQRRVYLGPGRRWRLHHGLAGAALAVAGVALIWHDRADWPWPLRDRLDR